MPPELIDELATDACRWFLDHADPDSGLVRDRGPNLDLTRQTNRQASISATGFYLTLLPELERRGLLSPADAAHRAARTLGFALRKIDHVNGVLPHFPEPATGRPWRNSEFSVLDTAIFLHGCIVASCAYPVVRQTADELLDRINWKELWTFSPRWNRWLLSYGYHGADRTVLPGTADVRSSENLMPCLLAAGSRTHPLGPECWYHTRIERWKGPRRGSTSSDERPDSYRRLRARVLNPAHPLFTSQYGLVWADLRGLHDADGIDLWTNARDAALLNRAYCRGIAARISKTYDQADGGWWGLSAGDSPRGYVAAGPVEGDVDGTVFPTAALASIQWIDDTLESDLRRWHASPCWPRARGKYGLAPFSLDKQWFGNDLIGIDVGCFAATYANARHNVIHRLWSSHPLSRAALRQLDFSSARRGS